MACEIIFPVCLENLSSKKLPSSLTALLHLLVPPAPLSGVRLQVPLILRERVLFHARTPEGVGLVGLGDGGVAAG